MVRNYKDFGKKGIFNSSEGSELHLKFLDKLINIASETDTQLKDGYVKYALEIYKKEKNESINLKTLIIFMKII